MRAGYSLLEVLVAFALMTMILTALIPGQARLSDHQTKAVQQYLAIDYALSRMATLGLNGIANGELGRSTYRAWQVNIEAFPTQRPEWKRVVVTVHAPDGRRLARVVETRQVMQTDTDP